MTWRERVRWDRLGRRRSQRPLERLRGALAHNFGLKLLSLAAAFALWVFVNASERDTETAVQVPLELHNIPRQLMIVSPRVNFIDLRVSGSRTLLSRINTTALAFVLDLGGVRPGPAVFRIVTDTLDLPRGVKVVRVTPSEVTIELARIDRRSIPVHVALTGKPPGDLRVTEIKVAPETVEVIGPGDIVDQLKAAETQPMDLSDASSGVIERDLTLEPPREHLAYTARLVHAQVRLEEPEQTRVLRRIPVVVRNSTQRTALDPETVTITVRGPKSSIESLELDHGAVYIDAAGLEPGGYTVVPSVDVPADVELVREEPATLQLRVLREKRKIDGR